jgi:hypothetical protein
LPFTGISGIRRPGIVSEYAMLRPSDRVITGVDRIGEERAGTGAVCLFDH